MSAHLEIRTLGPYQIFLDGQPLTSLTSRTAEALLIYLVRQPRPIARAVLADFFWDERDSERASANLRTVLTMLRKELGDYLIVTRRTVAFNHQADYWLDLEALEAGMAKLEPVLAQAAILDLPTLQQLDATLTLVGGDFLEGFHLNESRGFEAWQTQIQAQVQRLAADGLHRLIAACLHHGEYRAGIAHADRWLAMDPYNEDAHRQMLWLLARNGQRRAALDHYAACVELLQEELGVGPEAATQAVYRRILALPAQPPHVLPPDPTPFVGRPGEAEELCRRLSNVHCRLLTLLGPGGMGKTRLAVRAAQLLAARGPGTFLDGIYFVPLATVTSPTAVVTGIVAALNLPPSATVAPETLVRNHLATRELLLILDSVEQLAPQDAFVEQVLQLLKQAPGLKLLLTSRACLHLQEEWIYDLDGLDYPPASTSASTVASTVDAASAANEQSVPPPESYAAGHLFLQHAARLQRRFVPSRADAAAILEICRRLDGQPLGLELAAAWTRSHTCAEIAAHIDHDLDFLDSALRNVPARQRSLRAVFEYSWSQLAADEQRALCCLAVFVGQVPVATATAVAGVCLEQLEQLAGKSLVRLDVGSGDHSDLDSDSSGDSFGGSFGDSVGGSVSGSAGENVTFVIHESIRQYALEQLQAMPALEVETRDAYCRYYSGLLAQLGERLHTAEQLAAQAKIQAAQSNLRAAWVASVERGWWEPLGVMLDSFYWYWWRRSEMQEARALLELALAACIPLDTSRETHPETHPLDSIATTRARLQCRLANCLLWLGDYAQVRTLAQRAESPLRRAQEWSDLAWLYETLGQLEYNLGNYGAAETHLNAALDWFRRREETHAIAHVLCGLANALCDGRADYARARALYDESLRAYEQVGDLFGRAKVTINLGALAHIQGEHEQAAPYYAEGIAQCRQLEHRQTLAIVLNNMGQVQKALGRREAARALLDEGIALRRELGDRRGLAFTLLSLADLLAEEDAFAQAYAHAAEAVGLGLELESPAVLADILLAVGGLVANAQQVSRAAQLVQVVLNDPVEGAELKHKAQAVLGELETADRAAAGAGARAAQGQDMIVAAHLALDWLRKPAPRQDTPVDSL